MTIDPRRDRSPIMIFNSETLFGYLREQRKVSADRIVAQQKALSAGLTVAAMKKLETERKRSVESLFRAQKTFWLPLLETFRNWQVLEMRFPEASNTPLDSLTLEDFQAMSTRERFYLIKGLFNLQPVTLDGLDQMIRDAATGDRSDVFKLNRLKDVHHKTIESAAILLAFCHDGLFEITDEYYSVPRTKFEAWITRLKRDEGLAAVSSPVEGLLIDAISITYFQLMIWTEQRSGFDHGTGSYHGFTYNIDQANRQYQLLKAILNDYRMNRFGKSDVFAKPDMPPILHKRRNSDG